MRVPLLVLILLGLAGAAQAAELPLVEVPATGRPSDTFVVFVSGDGGWAKIDKAIAGVFAAGGMPVVGLNSLEYFWTKRTPDSAARDLQTIIDTYSARWGRSRVILAGYSRGADVLPAMASRLSADARSRIRLVALLAPSPTVEFEFHVADWLHDSARGLPVRPELEKLTQKTICIWGEDDATSLCRGLNLPHVQVVTLRGSHHFEGDYDRLARIILEALP